MKINKKTTLAVSSVLAVGALAATLGTMSYFTDTKQIDNVFVVGNVKIDILEKQRVVDADTGCKTTQLEDYDSTAAKTILPIIGSAQGLQDSIGMPLDCKDGATVNQLAKNYVDKMITVKNEGTTDAWVRTYYAIRSELDDGYDTFNASQNGLHFNMGTNEDGKRNAEHYNETTETIWRWKYDNKWNYYETIIDGKNYNVYYADYLTKLPAGETTSHAVNGLYLDKDITVKYDETAGKDMIYGLDANSQPVSTGVAADEQIEFSVYTIVVQASGFDSAASAVDASFGVHFDPFNNSTSTGDHWQ